MRRRRWMSSETTGGASAQGSSTASEAQRLRDDGEILERNSRRRSVRTHLDTGRTLRTSHAQIALRGEIDELRLRGRPLLVLRGISRIEHLPVLVSRIVRDEVGWFLVRDHHDVVPRTALGARFAADADVVVDRHLECAERAGNRASRAADHTDRVAALLA